MGNGVSGQQSYSQKYESLPSDIIGKGSTSLVLKATPKQLTLQLDQGNMVMPKAVAVKMMAKKHRGGRIRREEVVNEAAILKKLQHPCIPQYYENLEDKNAFYLVMEYVDGVELLSCGESYTEEHSLYIIQSLLSAVSYLASIDILHRDIKPANILVIPDTRSPTSFSIKLIDFGYSISLETYKEEAPLKVVCGTLFYIAPEVLAKQYGFKADVWSTGMVLYALLCGDAPYSKMEGSRRVVMKSIKQGRVPFMDDLWCLKSKAMKELTQLLLTVNPKHRPSAEDALTYAKSIKLIPKSQGPEETEIVY